MPNGLPETDLLTALPVAVIGLDPRGCVDRVNAAGRSLLGEGWPGRHVGEMAWDHDGEVATVVAGGSTTWTLREALKPTQVAVEAAPRPDGGHLLVLRDVTREQQLAELLEDQKDAMEALGTGRPLDEVLERVADLVHYGIPGAVCAILDFDEGGQELRVRAAPGLDDAEREALRDGTASAEWNQIPIHSSLGSTIGILALRVAADQPAPLSDEVLLTAVQLSSSAIMARRGDAALLQAQKLESLGLLAGGIAHDFNNLLTSSLGNLELLREHIGVASPLHPYLSRVERSTRKAAELTRQLLTYSGRSQAAPRPVDLPELLRETADLLAGTVPSSVQLTLELDAEVPPVVADESQLQQVVMNLCINGAEAIGTAPGHLVMGVRSCVLDAAAIERSFPGQDLRPGAYVELEVRDDGCGMTPATQARIFDPFFTTKFTGRGLGLAATAGVVRALRAGVFIQSELGVGTSFRVLLPAGQAGAPVPERAPERQLLQGSGRILVVDDEHDVRQLVSTVLESSGFDVVQAADGKEAVELHATEGPFRLIVMDLTMPRMGGGEALDRIRDIDPDIPCLLASGYPEGEAPVGDARTRFIQKPFRLARLKELIGGLLAGDEE